jgi:hypothetical protein
MMFVEVGGGAGVGNNGVHCGGSRPGGEDGVDIPPGASGGGVVAVELGVKRLAGAGEPALLVALRKAAVMASCL